MIERSAPLYIKEKNLTRLKPTYFGLIPSSLGNVVVGYRCISEVVLGSYADLIPLILCAGVINEIKHTALEERAR